MTKILVTGANGQLGQSMRSIVEEFEDLDVIFSDIEELDICDFEQVKKYTLSANISYLVNCAAYTAVDKAEHERVMAKKLNAEAVKNIALAAKENKFKVIHISTDYVFDGNTFKPYTEDSFALPESYYGQTKLLGEKYLLENHPESIIFRTSWLYSQFANNFVKTMIRLGKEKSELRVVADQIGTPTYAVDLACTILQVISLVESGSKHFIPGVYHYSNEGVCSWYDFTIQIHQLMGIECNVVPIDSKEYPTAAPRPFYSVLSKRKIKDTYRIKIPYWRFSLEKCLQTIKTEN